MPEAKDVYVKLPQLATFKGDADKAYVAQEEGKVLSTNDYDTASKTKLDGLANIKKVQVNSEDVQVGEDGTLNIDVQGVIDGDDLATDQEVDSKLADYTKTSELPNDQGLNDKFLDKETAQSTYANKNDIPKIQIPTCTKSELEEKKATAVDGDRVVVSDDEYHIYIYVGEADTGEWKDTGTHVVLTDYVKKEEGKSLVLDTDVTQIGTNKSNIESLQTTVAGLDEKYVKSSDIQTATDEDIHQLFQAE